MPCFFKQGLHLVRADFLRCEHLFTRTIALAQCPKLTILKHSDMYTWGCPLAFLAILLPSLAMGLWANVLRKHEFTAFLCIPTGLFTEEDPMEKMFVTEERRLKGGSVLLCNTVVSQYWAIRHIDQSTCISVVSLLLIRDIKKLLAVKMFMWNEFLGLCPVFHNLTYLIYTQKTLKTMPGSSRCNKDERDKRDP